MSSSSSTSETCNSRRFSWLMKSCFPNTTTTTPPHHHHPTPLSTTICCLPDDLLLECLTRLPLSTLPSLSSVCRRWAHLLNSPSFSLLRRRNHHHLTHHTLFSISISNSTLLTATLKFKSPNQTLIWKLSSFVLGNESPSSSFSVFSRFRLVSIGRRIYVIGNRGAMLRCDTWTGTLVPKSGMNFQRKKFAAAAVNGKIYVAGGSARSAAVEEFDPDENVWRVVSECPRRRYGCIGASIDGVFYVIGGLKIANCESGGATSIAAAREYASSMDLYDVAARVWLRSRSVPGGGCVVAACAVGDKHVYVLSSHAVELSFWRFEGRRRSAVFGEWCRIRSPPLPAQVRLDSSVRFSCVGVGDKVVLIQVVDIMKEGLVLVYDDCGGGGGGGEWSRAADLPEVMRRAACVCVEC